jgi:hypothetical protein
MESKGPPPLFGKKPQVSWWLCIATPICLRLLVDCTRRACATGRLNGGQQEADEDADDRDDDQQLDERECRTALRNPAGVP